MTGVESYISAKTLINIDDHFGDCRALARYYIEPNCQQVNPADENEDGAISTVRANIFSTLNDFLNRDIVVRDGGDSQMFVLADAGMGKTSLLMILKLTHLMAFWPQGYECVLLKLGEDTLTQIDQIDNKTNTLLLLDSLDEDPQCRDGQTSQRLIEVLEKSKNFRRVIITCRTQFFPQDKQANASVFNTIGKITFANFSCPLVYLSLFNDTQVEAYLKARYPKGAINYLTFKENPKVSEASLILKKTDSLQFRPFLLAHIEDILDAAELGADEYQLYHALIDTWLDREVRKLRLKKQKEVKKADLLQVCIWLAQTMHLDGKNSVSLSEVEKFCHRETAIELLSTEPERVVKGLNELDISANSLLNRNSDGEFRFSHLSIREFLLVYGVAEQLISGTEKPLVLTDKMRRFFNLTNISQPFHFVNDSGNYVLYGCRLTDVKQLEGRSLKNAEVDWEVFFANYSTKKTWLQFVSVELQAELLNLLGLLGLLEQLELLEQREHKELREQRELLQQREQQELQELRELREQRELQELPELELRGLREMRELREQGFRKLRKEIAWRIAEQLAKQITKRRPKPKRELKAELRAKLTETDQLANQLANQLTDRLNCIQLQTINLEGANLKDCDFSQVNLSGANLKNTTLRRANFNGADLSYADLTGADLTDADLTKANLADACLTDAILPKGYKAN